MLAPTAAPASLSCRHNLVPILYSPVYLVQVRSDLTRVAPSLPAGVARARPGRNHWRQGHVRCMYEPVGMEDRAGVGVKSTLKGTVQRKVRGVK
jgi:hypothetical protein